MVRYEDPPGKVKHIRLGKISPEIYSALVGFPGVKSIVLHAGGSKGGSYKEHPHYHVWYESESEQTNQTIRNKLKKLPEFAEFSGQQDWSFRNHDSWETWASYVCKNQTHKVLLEYRDLLDVSKLIIHHEVPKLTYEEAVKAEVAVIKKKASRAERWKLKDYLIETWNWKENAQFHTGDLNGAINICKARITSWYSGWLDDRDGIRMLRFLLYTFATDELRDELSFNISKNWDSFVRP